VDGYDYEGVCKQGASSVIVPDVSPTSYHDSASAPWPVASPVSGVEATVPTYEGSGGGGYEISFNYNTPDAPSSCPAGYEVETVEECKEAGLSVGGNLHNGEVYVGTWPFVR
jgi:hypothetical protein